MNNSNVTSIKDKKDVWECGLDLTNENNGKIFCLLDIGIFLISFIFPCLLQSFILRTVETLTLLYLTIVLCTNYTSDRKYLCLRSFRIRHRTSVKSTQKKQPRYRYWPPINTKSYASITAYSIFKQSYFLYWVWSSA